MDERTMSAPSDQTPIALPDGVSVFGATGFIGSAFCAAYPDAIPIPRNQFAPASRTILYLISTTHNYHVHENPFIDIETNLVTLVKVLEQCRGKDVQFNFVSSWFVYGDTDLPAAEMSPCHPKGFYSITKYAAEQLLDSYCRTFNIPYRVIRLGNVLGPGDKGVSKRKNALQFLLQTMLRHEDISLYYKGEFYRDYVYIDDVVAGLRLIMDKGSPNEIYNLGCGKPVLFKDIIEHIAKTIGYRGAIRNLDAIPFHGQVQVKSMYLNTEKIARLGFQPRIDVFEAVNRLIRHYTGA
jgi:nucleoside-diphosphate-sugar epimerase